MYYVATVDPARTVGVVGAGTMGSGIAQLAAQSGLTTILHDPIADALERGLARIERQWERRPAPGARERLSTAGDIEALAECDLVIEAAPESLDLKGQIFRDLAEQTDAVLATNTSSIPVTAIGAASGVPERVVGMHFFNPPPVMKLLEVVAGVETGPDAVALARATGEAMGRRVIEAADVTGFLVNRCNRPFALEALRLVQERVATPEEVDRICRLGGGFRMGPFELMDLVGIDVGFEIAKSFYEQSFGEPRWRPSPLQAQMVAAGRLGRKSERGWYAYPGGRPEKREEEPELEPGGGDGLVVIAGALPVAAELAALATAAGWEVATPEEGEGRVAFLSIDAGADEEDPPLQGGPRALLCADRTLAAQEMGGGAVGFSAVPPLESARLVELTRRPGTSDASADAAVRFFSSLGKHVAWVADSPGLVLGRIVATLVNEAAFSIGQAIGNVQDVDDGMVLGLNHPRGPLAWADAIGIEHVIRILDGLAATTGTDRYGIAPLLQRMLYEDATFHG
jgi:3-hydroxybutyryl-CoA dehydrogenase